MDMLRLAAAFAVLICAVGTAAASSASLILHDGRVLQGTSSISISGDTIEVGDGRLACRGTFLPPGDDRTVALNLTCSDGRIGTSRVVRDSLTSGHGRVFFNRGADARLVFGTP